jgi:hypothetical protein
MAKKTKAQDNDTPVGRAAKEIAAARAKLASRAVASGATPQKRVTRSSALRNSVVGNAVDERTEEPIRVSRGDEASSGVESDQEEDADEEVISEEVTRRKSLGIRADRASLVRRGGQAASSDSDEVAAVKREKKGLAKRKRTALEEAASTDEGDRLSEEPASPKLGNGVDKRRGSSQGSSDKLRELERRLKNAEGQ